MVPYLYLFDFGTDHQVTTSEARSKRGGTVKIHITSRTLTLDPMDPMHRHLVLIIQSSPPSIYMTILRRLSNDNSSQHNYYHLVHLFLKHFPMLLRNSPMVIRPFIIGTRNNSPHPSCGSLICTTYDFIFLFIYVSQYFII